MGWRCSAVLLCTTSVVALAGCGTATRVSGPETPATVDAGYVSGIVVVDRVEAPRPLAAAPVALGAVAAERSETLAPAADGADDNQFVLLAQATTAAPPSDESADIY